MRFKGRNVRKGRKAEGFGNIGRALWEPGGSEGVNVSAEDRLCTGVCKIVGRLKVMNFSPFDRDGLERRFCGTGGRVDLARMKGKDGRWGLFDRS